MSISLCQNIRMLRKRSGKTQEDLAAALGVTAQAVSRWESGSGYPDMESIPSIANYFSVSIDELFGYDQNRNEKIKSLLAQADDVIYKNGDLSNSISNLRSAVVEFPNNAVLLQKLGFLLGLQGSKQHGARQVFKPGEPYAQYDLEYNKQNPLLEEASAILNKALALGLEPKLRDETVVTLIRLYAWQGETQKAVSLAQDQPSVKMARECLLPMATDAQERVALYGEQLIALLRQLVSAVLGCIMHNGTLRKDAASAKYLVGTIEMMELLFPDGKFGILHHEMSSLYFQASDFAARNGEQQKALQLFDAGFQHKTAYQQLYESGQYQYGGALTSCVCDDTQNWPKFPETHLGFFLSPRLKEIIKTIHGISTWYNSPPATDVAGGSLAKTDN